MKAVVKGDYKYIANRPTAEVIEKMKMDSAKSANSFERTVGWDGFSNKDKLMGGVRFSNNLFFDHYFDADQLYNLSEDVYEQNNIISESPDKGSELKDEMKKIMQNWPYPFGEFTATK